MTKKSDERRGELRNTTVMEVILAVIIILIFFVYDKQEDNKEALKEIGRHAEIIEQKEIEISELKNDKKKLKESLKKKNEKLNDVIEQLTQLENEFDNLLLNLKKACEDDEECIRGLPRKPDIPEFEPEIEPEIETELDKGLGGGGKDRPNCITDLDEEKTYLADLYLYDYSSINPEDWKYQFKFHDGISQIQREDFILNIPGIKEMDEKEILSEEEFKLYGKQIKKWSVKQIPKPRGCRFHAVLHQRDLKTLDPRFLRFQAIATRYFYQLLRK